MNIRLNEYETAPKTVENQVAAGSNLLFAGRIDGVDNILIEKF